MEKKPKTEQQQQQQNKHLLKQMFNPLSPIPSASLPEAPRYSEFPQSSKVPPGGTCPEILHCDE